MTLTSAKFVFRLAGFSILLLAVHTVSQKIFPSAFHYEHTYALIAWYFLLTTTVHLLLMRTGGSNEKSFIRAFMTTVSVRFMLHMVIIFIWAFTHRETAVAFIISYFVLYLCFTLFEILMLMKSIRNRATETKKPLT
jgi:hypothetical protein